MSPDPHIKLQMSIRDAFLSISDFIAVLKLRGATNVTENLQTSFLPRRAALIREMQESALHHYRVFRRHLNIDSKAPDPHIKLQMSIQDAFFSISDFI